MPRAVRFEQYGGVDVLNWSRSSRRSPVTGNCWCASGRPGSTRSRPSSAAALFQEDIPISFPAAQGTDLAGVVEQLGPDVDDFAPGDEVLGTTASAAVRPSSRWPRRRARLRVRRRCRGRWPAGSGPSARPPTAPSAQSAPGPGDMVVVAGASGASAALPRSSRGSVARP